MQTEDNIPIPFNFNPLKHHMGCIRYTIENCSGLNEDGIFRELLDDLKRIGNSVTDIYTGDLATADIIDLINNVRKKEELLTEDSFCYWTNSAPGRFRNISLPDNSVWVVKYLEKNERYFHIFPGRNNTFTYRSRGNSLKTAILYTALFDRGDISVNDLNFAREKLQLPAVKNLSSAESIISTIRLIQSG